MAHEVYKNNISAKQEWDRDDFGFRSLVIRKMFSHKELPLSQHASNTKRILSTFLLGKSIDEGNTPIGVVSIAVFGLRAVVRETW